MLEKYEGYKHIIHTKRNFKKKKLWALKAVAPAHL